MATSYLTQTLGSGPTLGTKCTVSYWAKRSGLSASDNGGVFGGYSNASGTNSDNFHIGFNSTDQFYCWGQDGGSSAYNLESTRIARDISGWYHVCWIFDSTEGSSSDRIKLYVNGVQETSWAASSYPSSSLAFPITKNGNIRTFGRFTNTSGAQRYFNGSVSNLVIVDGSALAATTFGEVDSTSGIWKYKPPSGVTFGTNGCWLKGENSGNLGLDSGASNNFSSGGGTPIQSIDTPSNVLPVFNSLEYYGWTGSTMSNANTTYATPTAGHRYLRATLGAASGKFYFECKLDSSAGAGADIVGLTDHEMKDGTDELTQDASSIGYVNDGSVRKDGSNVDSGEATYTSGDIISVAVDITNSKIYFRKNDGSWLNSADPVAGTNGYSIDAIDTTSSGFYHFAAGDWVNPGTDTWSANFGNGYFGTTQVASAGTSSSGDDSVWEYDCPTGYYGMNTKNLNTYG